MMKCISCPVYLSFVEHVFVFRRTCICPIFLWTLVTPIAYSWHRRQGDQIRQAPVNECFTAKNFPFSVLSLVDWDLLYFNLCFMESVEFEQSDVFWCRLWCWLEWIRLIEFSSPNIFLLKTEDLFFFSCIYLDKILRPIHRNTSDWKGTVWRCIFWTELALDRNNWPQQEKEEEVKG